MSYKEGLEPALRNLSFVVEAGEHVAVVGRTGAGKSSLFQLLFGFRQPNKGQVMLDEYDITSMDLTYLRNELNVVLQQPFVIPNDTIRQNLDPRGLQSDQYLEEALLKSSLIKTNLPESSLDLDSKASMLSTGQVQLLALT